jgi:predicted nucleotidyltransferase
MDAIPAEKFVEEALGSCRSKANGKASGIMDHLHSGDAWAHSALRYCLARRISAYLRATCPEVKAVYIFGSTMDENAGITSDIDLLVVVKNRNRRLMRRITELKTAVLGAYKGLIGNGTSALGEILDISILEEKESAERTGYASLMHSVHSPALLLE